MRKRRVLLFSAQKLLGESLENTLSQIEDLEIAGHRLMDEQALVQLAVDDIDLIIMTDEGSSRDQLSRLTAHILDKHPDMPVFWVTLERNQMQVFSSHLVPARSKNLIDLIQHLPFKQAGLE